MAFVTPEKLIKTPNDIEKWHKSETYSVIYTFLSISYMLTSYPSFTLQDYIRFITGIGDGLKNKKIHDPNIAIGESAQKLIDLLETLSGWVDDIKPFETPNRFGNKAFRDWHAKLKEVRSRKLLYS
jgi:Phosphotyrosyl phosphatase activator